jgi:hypothetical protein
MLLGECTTPFDDGLALNTRPWVVLGPVRMLFWCTAQGYVPGVQLTLGLCGSRGPRRSSARTTTRWSAACAACRCRCPGRTTRKRRQPSAGCCARSRATSAGAARSARKAHKRAVAGPQLELCCRKLSYESVQVLCLHSVPRGRVAYVFRCGVDAQVARCAAHVCMPRISGHASQWALADCCWPACARRAQAEDAAGARERPTCALTMMIRARDDDVCSQAHHASRVRLLSLIAVVHGRCRKLNAYV